MKTITTPSNFNLIAVQKLLIHALFALPFVLSVLWAFSIAAFGLGALLPYIFLIDSGYGFGRMVIYGSLFHIGMFATLNLCIYMIERINLNHNCLAVFALIELTLLNAHISDYLFTW